MGHRIEQLTGLSGGWPWRQKGGGGQTDKQTAAWASGVGLHGHAASLSSLAASRALEFYLWPPQQLGLATPVAQRTRPSHTQPSNRSEADHSSGRAPRS
jgi:hypothetical protein